MNIRVEKIDHSGIVREVYQDIHNTIKMFHGNDIETSSPSTDSEWQTARSHRTAVPRGSAAYKPSGTGYVPPSLRSAAAIEAAKKQNPTSLNADDFPSLGLMPKAPTSAWGAKTSFAQKVNDLIAHEHRTEAEKEAEKEVTKEMDGWEVLSLCFDKERCTVYAEMFAAGARLERLVTDAALTEDTRMCKKKPMPYSTNYDDLHDDDHVSDVSDVSDNDD